MPDTLNRPSHPEYAPWGAVVPSRELEERHRKWAGGIALVLFSTGVLGLVSWWLWSARVAPSYAGVSLPKPLESLGAALLAASLGSLAWRGGRSGTRLGPLAALGGISAALAGIAGRLPGTITRFDGRMGLSPASAPDPRSTEVIAICQLLLGIALLLANIGRGPRISRGAMGVSGLLSLVVLLGLINSPEALERLPAFSGISMISALSVAFLAFGFILATPEDGIGAILSAPHLGGVLARQILPVSVLLPLVFRIVRAVNDSAHLLPAELFAVILSALVIVVLSAVVLLTAWRLESLDEARIRTARRNAALASIVTNSQDGIISQNLQGTILSWNAGATALYGYAEAEALGASVRMLAPEDRVAEVEGTLARVASGETIANIETVRRHKNGNLIPVSLTVAPIRDENGVIIASSAVIRDLSKLREYERRFRSVVESAPIAIVVVDGEGKIVLVNGLVTTLFGYDRSELIGTPVDRLLPDSLATGHGELRRGYMQAPEAGQMGEGRDLYARRKDGSDFPVEIGLSPIESSGETLILAAIADITERKRNHEALMAYARDLKRSNDELEQFAYVASHDLQEPLRMVVSYMELFESRYKGVVDERADQYIYYAVDGARRMQRLVQDLLTVSRVSSQAKPLQPTSSEQILKWVLRSLGPAIREAGAEVAHDPMPMVMADEVQLGQVFQNLIGNAIKFRSERAPIIQVRVQDEGEQWRFSVRDNGIGIEREHLDRIFQMFQRLHERDKYEGSGIGLPVSKKIVERHGGTLTVESTPGEGSVFTFTLPKAEESR